MDIFVANIGKLFSNKLLPIYTPTSNAGAYLFIFSPTLTHYILGGGEITVFKIVILVPGY